MSTAEFDKAEVMRLIRERQALLAAARELLARLDPTAPVDWYQASAIKALRAAVAACLAHEWPAPSRGSDDKS